jgi:hypothetical protein
MVESSLLALAGACVGVVVGLTGIGGGALMTPILVLLFGVPPSLAVGTDLIFASVTKAFGAATHGRQGTVDWVVVRRLASGSLPAAALPVAALAWAGRDRLDSGVLVRALGLVGSAPSGASPGRVDSRHLLGGPSVDPSAGQIPRERNRHGAGCGRSEMALVGERDERMAARGQATVLSVRLKRTTYATRPS